MTKIQCPKCEGKGEVPLSPSAADTMAILKQGGWWDSQTILSCSNDSVTLMAMSNRLMRLLRAGLVERKRNGKWWLYRRTARKEVR